MPERIHLPNLSPCPFLPSIEKPLAAASMKQCGKSRGQDFYLLALQCAQSLWLQGFPAQSLLLINRAFGADHESNPSMCDNAPLPYAAAAWVMQHCEEGQFIGNPRRHYQHLATRMVPPRKEQRSWRAWACWELACILFPNYPADEEQLTKEQINEPSRDVIFEQLTNLGLRGEPDVWMSVIKDIEK